MSHLARRTFLLIFILLVKLSGARSAKEWELFVCPNEFEQNDVIKKMAIDEQDLYLFLDNKILRVESPEYLRLREEGQDVAYLTAGRILVQRYDSNSQPAIMTAPNPLGLIRTHLEKDDFKYKSYLIFKNKTETMVKSLGILSESFDKLGARDTMLERLIKVKSDFSFIRMDDDKQLEIAFNKSDVSLRIEHKQIRPSEQTFELKIKVGSPLSLVGYLERQNNEKGFLGFLLTLGGSREVGFVQIGFERTDALPGNLSAADSFQIPYDEFFHCKRPFTKLRQVKGIFWSSGVFYVFIDNYYLMLDSDRFVKSEFLLSGQDYQTAGRLEILGKQGSKPEWLQSKWLRALRNNTYITMSQDTYLLKPPKSGGSQLETGSEVVNSNLKDCRKQTLQVGGWVFCFSKKVYFPFLTPAMLATDNNKSKSISEIFRPFGVQFDEEPQIIFNYENDKFIIMTEKEFVTLAYADLSLDAQQNIVIRTGTKIQKQRNCFFNVIVKQCQEVTTIPTESTGSKTGTKSSEEIQNDKLSKIKHLVIVSAVIIPIIVIVLVLCCLVGSKKKKPVSRTSSNSEVIRGSSRASPSQSSVAPDAFKTSSKVRLPPTSKLKVQPKSKPSLSNVKTKRTSKVSISPVNSRTGSMPGVQALAKSKASLPNMKTKRNSKVSISPANSRTGSMPGVQAYESSSIRFKSDFDRAQYKTLKKSSKRPSKG